ncbi:MAG: NADH-quinone oxidoreductase subunit N [Solirubrobacteraceae bacterium]|nr:NADH-quinone oxidoreductase subunit N [Solirubrobacteraceae bacterium]
MILAAIKSPSFELEAGAPFFALAIGMVLALMGGLFPGRLGRILAIWSAVASAVVAIVAAALLWNEPTSTTAVANSLIVDRGALAGIILASAAAIVGIALSARARGTEDAGHGETASLLIASALGAAILAASNDLVTVFVGLELLSIPLYILCASHVDRTASLESGLKYLILGSVGSATALMGIALIYGATGEMQFDQIAAVSGDAALAPLLIPGLALLLAGFAFKLSLAPLHQWTPDVYDGAPTATTAFMSVATKAAALIVTARLVITAFGAPDLVDFWQPVLYVLAAASIIVGNVGALGQPTMKRLMGYSSIAQAGYLVAAISVGAFGSMLIYLVVYAAATFAVFAVVAAREIERPDLGDDVAALDGLGRDRPLLAWIGTIGLFGLAGLPLTAGFFGKIAVAGALISGSETWLAVLLIIGSIISLAYYAPPVLRMWRSAPAPSTPDLAGEDAPAAESPDAELAAGGAVALATRPTAVVSEAAPVGTRAPWEVVAVGLLCAVLVVAGGLYPQPLLEYADQASRVLLGLR